MQKAKVLLLFPDGVGIRNYLYSEVFRGTEEDLILFHNFDQEAVSTLKKSVSLSETIIIPAYKESIKEKFLRELICLLRLRYNAKKSGNLSLLTNWNWTQKTLSNKIFYTTIQTIAPFIKKYDSILKLEESYQKAIRKTSFYSEVKIILKQIQPKIIFCSHQRALKAATVFAAAKDLGIPTATAIYSWDNLPKARLALSADCYLVWSAYMKKEMELFYPEIFSESVHVTGTPQFEFYEDDKNIIEREVFFKKYNLDLSKKIICFSGDDSKTSPDDPNYLKDIADEITRLNAQDQYQILLRRCPVDFSGRFDAVVHQYRDLIKETAPLWHYNTSSEWNAAYPSIEDVKLLVSTAFYADLVVNVGSTMAFDFAMFNKPCVFINYDQEHKNISDWSVKTIYQFQHFKSMPHQESVIWLNSKAEIGDKLLSGKRVASFMHSWKAIVIGDHKKVSKKIRKTLKLK